MNSFSETLLDYWRLKTNQSPWKLEQCGIVREPSSAYLITLIAVTHIRIPERELFDLQGDNRKLINLISSDKFKSVIELLQYREPAKPLNIRPSPKKIPPQRVPALTLAKTRRNNGQAV